MAEKFGDYEVEIHNFEALVIGAGGAGLRATFGMAEKGHLLLQEHDTKVAFRSLKIKELQFMYQIKHIDALLKNTLNILKYA